MQLARLLPVCRPTDHSIALNVLAPNDLESFVEYGTKPGVYDAKTAVTKSISRTPFEVAMDKLKRNTHYYYRLQFRESGKGAYTATPEYSFETQRPPNTPFIFDVQADSHPERVKNMFDATLYARTMASVHKDRPDFYITLGDDFSIDQIGREPTPPIVAQVYINQRQYLGMDGASTPIFLVNGGHEEESGYLLDGTPNNPAVWAGPICILAERYSSLDSGAQVRLTVEDSGPGIPEGELEAVFAPFYRPDTSRTPETGGVGLGLAIVKKCVETCGGRVVCRNRQPSGLAVDIHLRTA